MSYTISSKSYNQDICWWHWTVPLLLYLFFAIQSINLPGPYMDAVNPDYLSSVLLNEPGKVPSWLFADNLFSRNYRAPLLQALYGGAQPAYIYLIFAKLGFSGLVPLRLIHISFGAFLTIFFFIFLSRFLSPAKATVGTLLLCLDPGFVFSWRTQFYIQILPAVFFLAGLCVLLSKDVLNNFDKKPLLIAGLLLGFSSYGYFVYFMYSLAALVGVIVCVFCGSKKDVLKYVKYCVIGFLIGYSPFIFAHFSILVQSGFNGYVDVLKGMNAAYGIDQGVSHSFVDKLLHGINLLLSVPDGAVISEVVNGKSADLPLMAYGKWIVLIAIACIFFMVRSVIPYCFSNKIAVVNARIVFIYVFLPLSFILHSVLAIVIGMALGYQHFIMLMPMIYCAVIIYLNTALSYKCRMLFVFLVATILLGHAVNYRSSIQHLNRQGGVDFYSSAITDAANFGAMQSPDTQLAFPQWGYWMGVTVVDRGQHRIWQGGGVNDLPQFLNSMTPRSKALIYLKQDQVSSAKELIDSDKKIRIIESRLFKGMQGESVLSTILVDKS